MRKEVIFETFLKITFRGRGRNNIEAKSGVTFANEELDRGSSKERNRCVNSDQEG